MVTTDTVTTNDAPLADAAPLPVAAASRRACLLCGDPVDVPGVESEYCFQCAVHVKCSCAD